MFSFVLKTKRCIKKILKVQSESRQGHKSSVHSRLRKFLLLILVSVLIGCLYPGEHLYDPLDMPRKGEIAREDVLAPFTITLRKSRRELDEQMEVVRHSVPYVLDCDTVHTGKVFEHLDNFFTLADSIRSESDTLNKGLSEESIHIVAARFPLLSRDAIVRSLTILNLGKSHQVLTEIFRDEIYKIGVLSDLHNLPDSPSKIVLIRRGEKESIFFRERLLTAAQAYLRLLNSLKQHKLRDSIDVECLYQVGRTFIKPDLTVNLDEYDYRLHEELSSISNVKEVVNTGDIIVRSGSYISERQHSILKEMARLMRIEATQSGGLGTIVPVLARILLVLAAFSSFYLFLYYFRREIFNSNPKLLALFMVFTLQLLAVYLTHVYDLSMYLYPIAMLPIVVTILFDAEVGILSTLALALLLGIMHRFNFTLTLITMVIGTVACLTSLRVRKRTDFFKILLSIVATYVVFIFVVENLKFASDEEILTEIGYGLVSGIVSAFFAIGILPMFESLFGITTDITLLELSDMNHPLLKRLAVEAPGTYQHSIIVGNLSEVAAKAIGANSMLARVGAYYHDIGKIEIPEYFVENQLSIKSKHDELTPSVSALIIVSHVKRGRQLGEEADIPDDILNFIEEHHGTMVISYFYNKALGQGANDAIWEKFRYYGPKPQIRETGIAMVADAVEAASRTLENPKPARIQNLIQRIINERFQSGELDECPLTLRDLARIREAFAQVLIATFHRRVVYPGHDRGETEEE